MRSASRDLVVRFRGDADQLIKTTGRVEQSTKGMAGVAETSGKKGKKGFDIVGDGVRSLTRLFGPLLAAAGAFSVIDFAKGAITAASSLEQSRGAVEAIFKGQSGEIEKSAKAAADTLGLTENAYNELATTLGAGLKNKGIEDYTGKTQELIGLGADLAAQFGGSTADAVAALSSMMRGESDPIERYGVSINEAAINAELAAKGQSKLKGAALEQAKAQARLSLAFKQTKDAQGASARESETFASKQAKLTANWEELQAKIGEKFLPIVTKVVGWLSDKLLPAIELVADAVGGFFDGIASGDLPPWAVEIRDWMVEVREDAQPVLDAWQRVRDAFSAPEGGGIVAWFEDDLVPAVEGLVDAYKDAEETIRPIVNDIATLLGDLLADHAPEIESAAKSIGDIVTGVTGLIEYSVRTMTERAGQFWKDWGWLIEIVVTTSFDRVAKIVSGALMIVSGVIDTVLGLLTGDWDKAWSGMSRILEGAWKTIVGVVFGGVEDIGDYLYDIEIVEVLGDIGRWLGTKWVEVQSKLSDPIRKGGDAIDGFLDGLETGFRTMVDTVGDQLDRLKAAAKVPVNFVINTVYNDGLRAGFNKISESLGSKARLPHIPGLAGGGILTGFRPYGMGDDQLVHMRSGEGVYVSEAMRDPYERTRLQEVNRRSLRGESLSDLQHLAGGGWVAPVAGSHSGWNGGRYRSGKWHGGLDYPVPTGTPVHNPTAARVLSKQWLSTSYGIHAQLQSLAGGYRIILAHMSKMPSFPGPGAVIPQGYMLGLSGSTGNSTGPHLHFEVQPPGRGHLGAINPASLLGGRKIGGGEFHSELGATFDPVGMLADAFGGPLGKLGGLGDSPMAQLAKAWPGLVVSKAKEELASLVGLGGAGTLPVLTRDSGGPLPMGPSLVHNNTGREEWVSTGEQMDRLLDVMERSASERIVITPDHRGFRDVIRAVIEEEYPDLATAGPRTGVAS